MKKKYKNKMYFMGLVIIFGLVWFSYSCWQAKTKGINISQGCLHINYEKTGPEIKLDNAQPISDKEALVKTPYQFKITNHCKKDVKYDITLNALGNKDELSSVDEAYAIGLSSDKRLTKKLLSNAEENTDIKNIDTSNLIKSYLLASATLQKGKAKEYQLFLWIDEDALIREIQKLFSLSINENSTTTNDYLMSTFLGPTVLDSDVKKDEIENIYTLDTKEVPIDAVKSWDVSKYKNGEVIAYTKKNGEDRYDLYIGQDGGIKANPNSRYLFATYPEVKTIDLSHFDTSNVTNMEAMFSSIFSLKNLDLSHFDTSNVTNMELMFANNYLPQLDLSHFNTSNVSNMNHMFSGSNFLTQLDLSSFDTSNVTNMSYMFEWCISLIQLDLSHFDTTKVKNMKYMFEDCESLTKLDLQNMVFDEIKEAEESFKEVNKNITIYVKDEIQANKIKSFGALGNIINCISGICP